MKTHFKMMLSSKGTLPAHQISVQRLKLAPNSSEAGGSQFCKTQINEASHVTTNLAARV